MQILKGFIKIGVSSVLTTIILLGCTKKEDKSSTTAEITPTISIDDALVIEGNSGTKTLTFTVTQSAVSTKATTFEWETSDDTATAGADYVAVSATSESIAAGVTTASLVVTINGDTDVEDDETFTLIIRSPTNATIVNNTGTGTIKPYGYCALPVGASISSNQRYIEGPVVVQIQGGGTAQFTLHVQRLVRFSPGNWGTELISTFTDNGKTPCVTFEENKGMWQSYYQDMITKGIHGTVIQSFIDSISNPRNETNRDSAGIYAINGVGTCGYAGLYGWIDCGVLANDNILSYYVAHENTHGFQWETNLGTDLQNIILYQIFGKYANDFYTQSISDPSVFTPVGGLWSVGAMDYALQNESEWMADLFSGYLYPDGAHGTAHWSYIENNFPSLKSFFDCIWKTSSTMSTCQSSSGVPIIAYPETVPVVDLPVVSGFTNAESQAIWNTCFGTSSSASHLANFNSLIDRLTPGLYTNSASYYELGYGDCNHDGIMDWICSYKGLAPGGGSYLWNSANQIGAYTFVASGKTGDSYAEYIQDPYLTASSTLLQPIYSQWQGTYGSCNGAQYFHFVPSRFAIFSQGISNLPVELQNKTDW